MGLRRPSAREFAVQRISQVIALEPTVLDVVTLPLAERGGALQLPRRLRSHRSLKHNTANFLVKNGPEFGQLFQGVYIAKIVFNSIFLLALNQRI